MSEFARVKDPASGHEYTMAAAAVPEDFTILEEEAVDANGKPLPPRYAQPKELTDMKVDELRTYADELDIDLGGSRTKADIIAAIEAAPTSQEG